MANELFTDHIEKLVRKILVKKLVGKIILVKTNNSCQYKKKYAYMKNSVMNSSPINSSETMLKSY